MSDTDSDSSSDYDPFLANNAPGPKPPQKHHCTTYNVKWEATFNWIERYVPNNGYAHCKLCLTTFSIAHGGAHDVKRHQETVKHKKGAAANNASMESFNSTSTSMATESNVDDSAEDKFKPPNSSGNTSKNNRKKYMIAYNPKWEADFPWLRAAANSGSAHCTLCKGEFSIEYRGLHDVIRHIDRMKHRKALENPDNSGADADELPKNESNTIVSKTYNAKWEVRFPWIKPARSVYSAECKVCSAVFSIQHRGVADIERHQDRAKHKKAMEMLEYKPENVRGTWSDSDEPLSKFSSEKRTKRKNGGGESSGSTVRAKKEKHDESNEDYFENTSALYWDSFMANTKQEPNMSEYEEENDDDTYDPNDDYNESADPMSFESNFETVDVGTLPVIGTNASKQMRMATYNPNWELMYPWLSANDENPGYAICTICNTTFSINYHGIHDVKRHEFRQKHVKFAKQQEPIAAPIFPNMKRLRIAEATHVFHSVVHGHSHASTDCVERLYGKFFTDSHIAKKFSCDRYKATQIVHSVFVPIAQNQIILDLANNHPFSIATNTANYGNLGIFPIVVRYYHHNGGVKNKILTYFTPHSSETFQDVFFALVKEVESLGLSIKNATAFVADNSPINFKNNESVFSELLKVNGNLLPINCLRRNIQNAFQYTQKFLKFDIEMIVYKCFNELSATLDILPDELHSLHEWLKDDWPDIMSRIPTHWLCIVTAAAKFLQYFSALKMYFLGKSDVVMLLQQFFQFELAECYIGLFKNIGESFQTANGRLELSETAAATDLYDAMHELHDSLNLRRNERSYGSVASQRLSQIDNIGLIEEFHRDAYVYMDAAIKYLDKCHDFGNMSFKSLSIMQLSHKPALEHFQQIVSIFNINNINEHELIEEYHVLANYFDSNHIFNSNNSNVAAQQWWSWFFQSNRAPNFLRICNYVFSIPMSGIVAERISNELWKSMRSDRNHQNVLNLKADLLVKENLGSMTCTEFSNFLKISPIMDTMLTKEEQCDAANL